MDTDSLTLPQSTLVVLLPGSPHGDSMSTCLYEAAWTLRVTPERHISGTCFPPFVEGMALR